MTDSRGYLLGWKLSNSPPTTYRQETIMTTNLTIEAFTRWSDDHEPWPNFLGMTCPRCLRRHRVDPTDLKIINPCRDLQDETIEIIVRDDPMSLARKPLRSSDDPKDPFTPWIRVAPGADSDEPGF